MRTRSGRFPGIRPRFDYPEGVASTVETPPMQPLRTRNGRKPLMETWQIVLITLAVAGAVVGVVIGIEIAMHGGDFGRFLQARRIAKRWLADADFRGKVDALSAPPKPTPPPKPSAEPLWLLALLQREGRLLDF